jgi:Uma2 family endonuclease
LVGDSAVVSIQNPIRLVDSEPEPDVALLLPRADFYASAKPGPADVLLLIEVADMTLEFDRDVKRPLYAEAGVVEYWILNLNDDCLELHRQPQPDGAYREVQTLRHGAEATVAALAGVVLPVEDLL